MKILHTLGARLAVAFTSVQLGIQQTPTLLIAALLWGAFHSSASAQQSLPASVDSPQVAAAQQTVTATGVGTGMNIPGADAMATAALNAQKAQINARYGNTVRWGPVVTTRVIRYSWGRAYYETTKTQSGSLGF